MDVREHLLWRRILMG